jgi:hypothetical protein
VLRRTHTKNWLFAGNDAFGQHHAVLWSLIASAEAHGIDPQAYLRSVLAKIGQTPLSELGQFLPEVWKREAGSEHLAHAPIAVADTPAAANLSDSSIASPRVPR